MRVLIEIPEEKRSKYTIEMDLTEVGWEDVDRIDRD